MEPKLLAAKLLALAIDQAGRPEGELAREKAEKLIEKFGISRHDIDAAEARNLVRQEALSIPAEGWARDLLAAIAFFCCCTTLEASAGKISIFGRHFHIDVAMFYNEQVLSQLDEGFRSVSGSGLWPASEINDWRASFVLGVSKKLDNMRTNSADPFVALRKICIDAADAVLAEQFPNSVFLDSYSRERNRVRAAFESGASLELLSGIATTVVALLPETPTPEGDS